MCGGSRRMIGQPTARHFPLSTLEKNTMHIVTNVGPLAALIAGILILAVPRLLNFIVALYLIIIGLLGLFGDHIH
ncbi:hypothetical protein P3T43_001681 [Paraburkholderia sp. GAS41]